MKIEWNMVTWYSKWLAVLLFIVVIPAWTFYLGMRYEEVILTLKLIPQTSGTPTSGISFKYLNPENTSFAIKGFPDSTFKIVSLVKSTGRMQAESGCNSPASTDFLKNLYMGSSGLCLNLAKIDGEPISLIAVDIDVSNNGSKTITGDLIQLLYTVKVEGKDVTKLAQTYLPFRLYSVDPASSKRIRVGFMVPANQNEFSLTYGYVGVKLSDSEDFFAAGQGGYTVNFENKTVVPIQG
jgi:hypothetical protein